MSEVKMKSNATMAVEIDRASNRITFTVRDAGEIVLDMSRLSPEVLAYAAFHGMKQRIADAAAMSRNPDTGAPASPAAPPEMSSAVHSARRDEKPA